MAIIVAEEDTLVKEVYRKSNKTGKRELVPVLTLKPGVVVKCRYCGQPMIRYGITGYKKHIEDIRHGTPTKIFHLQILTCPNKEKCRDITSGKAPQGNSNKATHVLLPDYACPGLRVQSDTAEDLAKANKEIQHLKGQFNHTNLSWPRIELYISQSKLLHKLKEEYVNFRYFVIKALGPLGKHLSMPVETVLSHAQNVFETYSLNFNRAPVKTRGKAFDIQGKNKFRIFGVYCCSQFVNDPPIHLKHNWVISCNNMIIKEPDDSS